MTEAAGVAESGSRWFPTDPPDRKTAGQMVPDLGNHFEPKVVPKVVPGGSRNRKTAGQMVPDLGNHREPGVVPKVVPPCKGEPPGTPVPPTPLQQWLTSLNRRAITASVTAGVVELHGDTTDADETQAHRHRHTLTVAAAGTHPAWWAYASGRSPTVPTIDDLPAVAVDGEPWFACSSCGAPADWVDGECLAWCEAHR